MKAMTFILKKRKKKCKKKSLKKSLKTHFFASLFMTDENVVVVAVDVVQYDGEER